MTKWMKLGIGVFVLAVAALIVVLVLPAPTRAPTTDTKQDIIRATAPTQNAQVSSPLTISGEARGNWYFEATFPYELDAADGTVLAQGPVHAGGDWMTTNFVPFSITITFPAQPAGSVGKLLLKKDNPSGLPQNEAELVIPVVFK